MSLGMQNLSTANPGHTNKTVFSGQYREHREFRPAAATFWGTSASMSQPSSLFSLVPPIQPGSFIGPTEHLKSAPQIIEMATIATNCRPSTPSQERQERWLVRRQRRGPATTQKQPFIIVTTTLVALLLCYSSTAPKSRLASKSSKKRFQARSPPKVSQRLGRWPCGRHWSQGQWWWHWWQQFQCHHNKNCYKHSKPHWNNNIQSTRKNFRFQENTRAEATPITCHCRTGLTTPAATAATNEADITVVNRFSPVQQQQRMYRNLFQSNLCLQATLLPQFPKVHLQCKRTFDEQRMQWSCLG